MKLRWSSVLGQIATIVAVRGVLKIEVPWQALCAVVLVEVLSNLYCRWWLSKSPRVDEWHLAAVMALDTLLLTLLLYFTGGPFNPFSSLYLVNIAVAAIVFSAKWTWMLVGFALICFGLFPIVGYRPLPLDHLTPVDRAIVLQQGVWVAFGVAATFIVYFLWRVSRALSDRDDELLLVREAAVKQERLASLATMAAGAAHELATPLGTIAVIAKELERSQASQPQAVEDLQLIRDQVARCRVILDQMSGGTRSGDQGVEDITVGELVREAMTGLRDTPSVSVDIPKPKRILTLPPRGAAQALRGFITNAQDASPKDKAVVVRVRADGGDTIIEVIDRGKGMESDVLARVGEPFYSTKAPGSGMGLGVFLGRAVFERLGGSLVMQSVAGEGTTVRVTLPPGELNFPGQFTASLSGSEPKKTVDL